jgi:pimeloyl-ACP methyl ester carboxylesterase
MGAARRTLGLLAFALAVTGCHRGAYERMETLRFDQLTTPGTMRTARVGDVDVRYFEAGVGPVVLLVHGLGEHAGYWNENVPGLLEKDVRVVAVDLPGHGASDKPHDAPYSMGWHAAVLRGLLDVVAPDEEVTVVGHSMGGQIALRLALTWPDRVKHLVLLAPAGIERFTPGEGAWLKQVSTTATFLARSEDELRAHYRKNVFGAWSPAAEHHLEERVRLRRAPDFRQYINAVVRCIHGMIDGPVADELPSLAVPATVLFGADDGLIPNPVLHGGSAADVAAEARRLLPRARVDVLPGLGHMLQVEAPTRVNAAILEAAR